MYTQKLAIIFDHIQQPQFFAFDKFTEENLAKKSGGV